MHGAPIARRTIVGAYPAGRTSENGARKAAYTTTDVYAIVAPAHA